MKSLSALAAVAAIAALAVLAGCSGEAKYDAAGPTPKASNMETGTATADTTGGAGKSAPEATPAESEK